jgi:hypothetical protein
LLLHLEIHHQKSDLTDWVDPSQPWVEVNGVKDLELAVGSAVDIAAMQIAMALTDGSRFEPLLEPWGESFALLLSPGAVPGEGGVDRPLGCSLIQHQQIGLDWFNHC